MPTRGGTLPRNVRVVRARLDSGSAVVGTRGTTASLGSVARLAEVPLEFGYLRFWVSFTIGVCALLLEVQDLVRGMFCKRNQWFENFSVLSLGEAGEWMFRDLRIFCTVHSKRCFCDEQARVCGSRHGSLVHSFPCYLHSGQVRFGVGIPCVGVRHVVHASLVSWKIGQPRPWRCGHVRDTRLEGSGFRCSQFCFPLIGCLVGGQRPP